MAASVVMLSILIPTIRERLEYYTLPLLTELERQTKGHAVEILSLYDNLCNTVGQKRNALLQMARGRYLTYVDDDDQVSPDYIECIFDKIRFAFDIDVICYLTECRVDKGPAKLCHYSVNFKEYVDTPTHWEGKPAHTMIWRSAIAKQGKFPNANYGEDKAWVDQVVPLVKKEEQIEKVLYYYNFDSHGTRTRG